MKHSVVEYQIGSKLFLLSHFQATLLLLAKTQVSTLGE
jgi:hypothetical protein